MGKSAEGTTLEQDTTTMHQSQRHYVADITRRSQLVKLTFLLESLVLFLGFQRALKLGKDVPSIDAWTVATGVEAIAGIDSLVGVAQLRRCNGHTKAGRP
jgi:hypothetical protein